MEGLPNTWFTKTQQRTIRGTPDYLACVNGVFVGIELKRSAKEKMKLTLQAHNVNKINRAQGLGLFVYPENWDKVQKVLTTLSQRGTYDRANLG